MTVLADYAQFGGRHWETGSVHNYYAYRGVTAPHTGKPMSEALLLGISGGIVFGYFSFAYTGYDPYVALLTRNTFDPFETMLARLGVMQTIKQTTNPDKGIANLLAVLDEGSPAIVSADYFSLPYNAIEPDEKMWGMLPLLVYGLDEHAHIADRSACGLQVGREQFQAARARVKKERHQVLTLEAPDFAKLPTAVREGIAQTIALFTDKPPKGSANNFGFKAYQQWIKLLTKPKTRNSWEKVFPAGRNMASAMQSSFERIALFGQAQGGAERWQYAQFLDEAAVILSQPALREVAAQFRTSAEAWEQLGRLLLPDDVPTFGDIRTQLERRRDLFTQHGTAALADMRASNTAIKQMQEKVAADFPLTQPQIEAYRQRIADHVQTIHDIEQAAITQLDALLA